MARKIPGKPCADSVPSWWRSACIDECVVEVPVPHFHEETGEVMNRDQLLDPSTVVKSVDDVTRIQEGLFTSSPDFRRSSRKKQSSGIHSLLAVHTQSSG